MQTAYETNFSSNMLMSPKELYNPNVHQSESRYNNSGIAIPFTDGRALPSKYSSSSRRSRKPNVDHAEQFLVTAGKDLFPYLEHNHEILASEDHVYEADQAPISCLSSEGSIPPIPNRHLDFGNDIFSNWYSSNEYSLAGIRDRTPWTFQYDTDLLETHSYNMTSSNSLDEKYWYHTQSGTSHPSVFDRVTEYNLLEYQEDVPTVSQVNISSNNHTQSNSEIAQNVYASEALTFSQEHRAYNQDTASRDLETSSERVITTSKANLGHIPDLDPLGHNKQSVNSNAYICVTADTRIKNSKENANAKENATDDYLDPRMDIRDYWKDVPCVDSINTTKSNQVDDIDETDCQLSTPFEHVISHSPYSLRINQKSHAQSHDIDSVLDSSTPSRSPSRSPFSPDFSPNFSPNHSSLAYCPVLSKGVNEIKQVCEAPEKRSDHREKTSALQNYELDEYWERSEKDKSYMCLYQNCILSFTRRYSVRDHIQTHLDYRQFRCKICSKCYVRRHDLNRHTKSHGALHFHKTPYKSNILSFRINIPSD